MAPEMNLDFVRHENHKAAINKILEKDISDDNTEMLFLIGSVARGDAFPESDLDLWRIVHKERKQSWRCEMIENVFMEIHSLTLAKSVEKIANHPMLTYGIIESKVLIDKTGKSADFIKKCINILRNFRPASDEIKGTLHWLKSLELKMKASLKNGNNKKALFLVMTGLWGDPYGFLDFE